MINGPCLSSGFWSSATAGGPIPCVLSAAAVYIFCWFALRHVYPAAAAHSLG